MFSGSKLYLVSIHAPFGATLEEVTPPPNEFYLPQGGGFKPELVFHECGAEQIFSPHLVCLAC